MSRLRELPLSLLRSEEPVGFNVFLYFKKPEVMLHFRRIGEIVTFYDLEMLARLEPSAILGFPDEWQNAQETQHRIEAFSREERTGRYAELTGEVVVNLQPLPNDAIRPLLERVPPMLTGLRSLLQKLSFTPTAAFEQAYLLYEDKDTLVTHLQRVSAFSILLGAFGGLKEPIEYAELAMAGMLHDLGLSRMPRPLILKHIQGREREIEGSERTLYEQHPQKTLDQIREAGVTLGPNSLRAIEHHHECFDGSGPAGKTGGSIFRPGHILRIADELVSRMSRLEGALDFKKALASIGEEKGKNKLPLYDPELISRLAILLKR